MKIEFHGAVETVTGSQFLVQDGDRRVLVDCGMFQGSPEETARNRLPFSYPPGSLDAVLLTHAHLDHCGRLPALVAAGYRGRSMPRPRLPTSLPSCCATQPSFRKSSPSAGNEGIGKVAPRPRLSRKKRSAARTKMSPHVFGPLLQGLGRNSASALQPRRRRGDHQPLRTVAYDQAVRWRPELVPHSTMPATSWARR